MYYGPELLAQEFVDWATEHGMMIHYIEPGEPNQKEVDPEPWTGIGTL